MTTSASPEAAAASSSATGPPANATQQGPSPARPDVASSSTSSSSSSHSTSPSSGKEGDSRAKAAKSPDSEQADEEEAKYAYNPGDRNKKDAALRQHVWQFWRPKDHPPPPPLTMEEAQYSPLLKANFLSQLVYEWATPMMVLGWRRALESTDLWKLSEKRESGHMSELLIKEWDRRAKVAEDYNRKLVAGEIKPSAMKKAGWAMSVAFGTVSARGKGLSMAERETRWRAPPPPGAWAPTVPHKKGKSGGPPPPPKPKNYSGHKRPSLILALHEQMKWLLWGGVFIKALGDVAQVTSPLVLREIIKFGSQRYLAQHDSSIPAPPLGHGIGWAFLLFVMQVIASIFQHQFFFRTMSVGVYSRSALIAAIFRRSTTMNAKDRSPGKLLNHASTDVSRIDFASAWSPLIATTPLQIGICLALLIVQIGPSALAGFGLLLLSMPVQGVMMKYMFASRAKSMIFTDQRSKLVNELLSGMRIVKSFSYESNFLKRMAEVRRKELQGIRRLLVLRSVHQAFSFSLPSIAAVISFIIYKAVGNSLNPANIFTALTLFQLLRMPLMFLPMSLSSGTDAYNAFQRLQGVFEAQPLKDISTTDEDSKQALRIVDAKFQWFKAEKSVGATAGKKANGGVSTQEAKKQRKEAKKARKAADKVGAVEQAKAERSAGVAGDQSEATAGVENVEPKLGDTAASAEPAVEQEPFALDHLDLQIPQGQLCAIVGEVGCGKSSLLAACLGEMPNKGGQVIWNSRSIGYVPQQAWIQAASVRENILFGRPFEKERYWRCVRLAELDGDLASLPQGDHTGIGERGITLSGGQKQRVSIARALYFDPQIFLFDDILSALDAHVGKAIFQNAILDLRARGKTILLVTHALHHLHAVDRIITMEDGRIAESGTFEELRSRPDGAFARLMEEFGGQEEEEEEKHIEDEADGIEDAKSKEKKASDGDAEDVADKKKRKEAGAGIMTQEQRNTGSVAGEVYKTYLKAGYGTIMIPAIFVSVCLMQGATVLNSYWLVFWQDGQFGSQSSKDGLYMGVYAALGIAQAILTFAMGYITSLFSFWACANMHADAMKGIIHAKMSFFDTTPSGRILNIFTKDMDVADNQLADAFRMALNTLGTVMGSIILITILTHYFVVVVAVIMIAYYFGAMFYRSSAREMKRLDAILRSSLYAHFSESLSGLVVVRAYGEVNNFVKESMKRNDHENRAYFLTIVNQRWLGIRLDFLGAILTLVVAIMVVAASSIRPGDVGVALSYVVTTTQAFSWMTRQVAEVENDMNSVERISYYATSLDQEAAQEIPNKVSPSWPERGEIEIRNIALRYRPGLPLVLHDVSLSVKAGEKVGIVGRTGAGKSSLLTGLLRLVELESGTVSIDGVDVSKIGLSELRRKVAVLPQDPLIFSGTLRSNLDPFDEYDDARLNDALRRAYLVNDSDAAPSGHATPEVASVVGEVNEKAEGGGDSAAAAPVVHTAATPQRFTLDTIIEEEGANLSLGQRSLVSLARALVKNSQIILLDEATASVDVKTDARIQDTIRTEFRNRTLLCIAHRLRTIISYDRIAVFDAGRVVEYASPLSLYDTEGGIFRDMCLKASISREEMIKAAAMADAAKPNEL